MGFFKDLFSRGYDVKMLKVKHRQVERERRKYQMEMRRLSARQAQHIDEMKQARKLGNNIQVDYLWEELKGIKHEMAFTKRSARVANLEGITLKRYISGIERLERAKDKDGIQRIITKMQSSGLEAKLQLAQVNEEEYMDELNSILESSGLEDEYSDGSQNDPEKLKLLSAIDAINTAEEGGEFDQAMKHERDIKKLLESEEQQT